MQELISRPTQVAIVISALYGHCSLLPVTPTRWYPCPSCAKTYGVRLTQCQVCDGSGRLAVMQ